MEDFVTFEIAKKLKENGFTQGFHISGCKFVFSDENTIKCISDIGAYETKYFGINVPCPNISQVLKWLRKEKEIMVFPVYSTNTSRWYCSIVNADSLDTYKLPISDSYEEATLAGIEYVLDNLI